MINFTILDDRYNKVIDSQCTIKEIDITIKNIKSSKFRLQTSKTYNYYVSLEELKKEDAQ